MAAKTVINTLALWVLESAREGQGTGRVAMLPQRVGLIVGSLMRRSKSTGQFPGDGRLHQRRSCSGGYCRGLLPRQSGHLS